MLECVGKEGGKVAEINSIEQLEETFLRLQMFAYRLTQNRDETNDLVQETMLKACVHQEKFRQNTSLYAWLYTIMRNTFFNMCQKRKSRAMVRLEAKNAAHARNMVPSLFLSRELRSALKRLSTQLRRPFLLYAHGFKYREIAQKLELPMGTVKSKIFLARQRLQLTLEHPSARVVE